MHNVFSQSAFVVDAFVGLLLVLKLDLIIWETSSYSLVASPQAGKNSHHTHTTNKHSFRLPGEGCRP
jgi:hypothetical protein